jgi:peroxiredoxin Q/BCP
MNAWDLARHGGLAPGDLTPSMSASGEAIKRSLNPEDARVAGGHELLVPTAAHAAADGPELAEGSPAPDVGGLTQDGKELRLGALRGKFVVLYFYPKDDTPGCTKQACNFRDSGAAYIALGAVVIGVSTDAVDSHKAFARKYSLPFPLIADTKGDLVRAFGVKKGWFGFTARTTFIIDPAGVVRRVFRGVNAGKNNDEVLESLKALGAGANR